jgi:hypothetical protein
MNPRATSDAGVVTAEFAVVLPTVFMIMAISLATLSAQLERFKLVSVAGMISRAVARAEPLDSVKAVFAEQLEGRGFTIESIGTMVCAEVSQTLKIALLPDFGLRLAETQCARKIGL